MNDCYQKNYQIFDWIIFFEVDEHIHLSNYTNIKLFLQRDIFKNCEIIHLNWVQHTDNNLIYYDNRPLHIRFPELEPYARYNINGSRNFIKSILRGHIPNVSINNVHKLTQKLKGCNGFGNPQVIHGCTTPNSDFRFYYIDHYYSKSVEEFVEKLNKGDVLYGQRTSFKYARIRIFFKENNITFEKLKFIENHTKLNLTEYKIRLKQLSNEKILGLFRRIVLTVLVFATGFLIPAVYFPSQKTDFPIIQVENKTYAIIISDDQYLYTEEALINKKTISIYVNKHRLIEKSAKDIQLFHFETVNALSEP